MSQLSEVSQLSRLWGKGAIDKRSLGHAAEDDSDDADDGAEGVIGKNDGKGADTDSDEEEAAGHPAGTMSSQSVKLCESVSQLSQVKSLS